MPPTISANFFNLARAPPTLSFRSKGIVLLIRLFPPKVRTWYFYYFSIAKVLHLLQHWRSIYLELRFYSSSPKQHLRLPRVTNHLSIPELYLVNMLVIVISLLNNIVFYNLNFFSSLLALYSSSYHYFRIGLISLICLISQSLPPTLSSSPT